MEQLTKQQVFAALKITTPAPSPTSYHAQSTACYSHRTRGLTLVLQVTIEAVT